MKDTRETFILFFRITNLVSYADTPDASRKMAGSTHSLSSGTPATSQGGVQPLSQRKRLLKAPTLAELDSSESDVRISTLYMMSLMVAV